MTLMESSALNAKVLRSAASSALRAAGRCIFAASLADEAVRTKRIVTNGLGPTTAPCPESLGKLGARDGLKLGARVGNLGFGSGLGGEGGGGRAPGSGGGGTYGTHGS